MNEEKMIEIDVQRGKSNPTKKVYVPGISRKLKDGEFLDYDSMAYRVFHKFETAFPCLSFDLIYDDLGEKRECFPMSFSLVSGTQSERANDNEIYLSKISNMSPENESIDEPGSENDSDDEKAECAKPNFHTAIIPQHGTANRIKTHRLGSGPQICAVWNDKHGVQLWNLSNAIQAVNSMSKINETTRLKQERPIFTFTGHSAEGFSLAWSPTSVGTLASGDLHKKIFLWNLLEDSRWSIDQRPLNEHEGSVEDLEWSPTENSLLASCSIDKSIRLWDVRAPPNQACVCAVPNAHESDVNVISWNKNDSLILSGGDDGALNIWSLKTIQYNQPVARFKYHSKPITSVEWHPQENTTFMASDDDQVSLWDISLEADGVYTEPADNELNKLPPQLLFIHMGQNELKEIHWHPQIPGLALTTALDGFNVFKTINI